jgi:hypothetical protein
VAFRPCLAVGLAFLSCEKFTNHSMISKVFLFIFAGNIFHQQSRFPSSGLFNPPAGYRQFPAAGNPGGLSIIPCKIRAIWELII